MSEHGASCYAPSTSPSTGSPHSVATGHTFGLPTPQSTPEGSQQDSPVGSPHGTPDNSPNSVTTGPNFSKKPLKPCSICALNPAKVCLQVRSLSSSIQGSGFMNAHLLFLLQMFRVLTRCVDGCGTVDMLIFVSLVYKG